MYGTNKKDIPQEHKQKVPNVSIQHAKVNKKYILAYRPHNYISIFLFSENIYPFYSVTSRCPLLLEPNLIRGSLDSKCCRIGMTLALICTYISCFAISLENIGHERDIFLVSYFESNFHVDCFKNVHSFS